MSANLYNQFASFKYELFKIIDKDDIKIVREFPCLLGHHVPFDKERVPAQWNLEIFCFPDNSQGALSVTGEPELPNSTQLNKPDKEIVQKFD